MASYKRKARCGYCYQEGHNRNSCPAVKAAAANGDAYAQERLERAKIKRCSYCKDDGHTKATCDKKFNDELDHGWTVWAGLNAAANIIRDKKLANGAFIYGPIQHRWQSFPADVIGRDGQRKPNYEMINFCIEEVNINTSTVLDEWSRHFGYTTLAEPSDDSVRLSHGYSLPGFFEEVLLLEENKFKKGRDLWIKKVDGYVSPEGRRNSKELCNVIVEAPQEEVDKTVAAILAQKPMIVGYTDRKTYQTAVRAQNKQNKIKDEED